MGAHSVSHVPISQMSERRRKFEIHESKRVIDAEIGSCLTFAYPYGMRGTYDSFTQADLRSAGFKAALLTHSVRDHQSSPFEMPRISIPDRPMSLFEFIACAVAAFPFVF